MANLDEQLWEACRQEDWVDAAFLVEAGAGTEWRGGEYEDTAIVWAAYRGSLETVTLLFNRGANIHAQGNDGMNALMEASGNNRADIVSFLADKGADIHVRNAEGWNALMYASCNNHADIVSFLADKGTDIHVRNIEGQDALLLAALNGRIDIALELIARQADARVVDNQNQTALTHFGSCRYISNLSAEEKQEKQQGQARLIAAWLAGPHPSQVAERHWQRRKNAVLFLVGSKFRPMQRDAAAAKLAQEQVDKHAKLPGIPRRSKEENLAYLHKEVFGHEGIQRCLVGML